MVQLKASLSAAAFLIFRYIKLSFFLSQFLYFFLLHSLELEPFAMVNFQGLNFSLRQQVIVAKTLIELKHFRVETYVTVFF